MEAIIKWSIWLCCIVVIVSYGLGEMSIEVSVLMMFAMIISRMTILKDESE